MFDFNDAEPQQAPMGALVPDGEFAEIHMRIRAGGADFPGVPADKGVCLQSKTSDALMLDCEFTVTKGPYAKRKFWGMFCVAGGKKDDKGVSIGWKISKSVFRAMIESATGLDPEDMGDAAKAKRTINALSQLNNITFIGRIMIEPATDYPGSKDQNKLANVVLVNEDQYAPVKRGEQVKREPIGAQPRKSKTAPGAAQSSAPAWAENGASGATHSPAQQQYDAAIPAWAQ